MPRKRQKPQKVYEFLKDWKAERDGNSPTYAEIAKHFNWKSETTAYWAVGLLERDGLVLLDENRRITLPGGEYTPPR